jgi:hypothetical protein
MFPCLVTDWSAVDDGSHPQAGRFEHLNDRKVTRDGRLASMSPKKGREEKTRFFGMFKKKKSQQTLDIGVREYTQIAEKDLFKGKSNSVHM